MKKLLILLFVIIHTLSFAQEVIKPTTEFVITGKVHQEVTISISDLNQFESNPIADLVITNHLGTEKGTSEGFQESPSKTS